jgi:hypothetical protein
MNPPTIGHEKLLNGVITAAKRDGADHMVYLSQRQKAPDNPLSWEYKKRLVQSMFPGVNVSSDKSIKTPYQALEFLAGMYDNVTMVVGDDRVQEFESGMKPYAEEWGIDNFRVVSAGDRDPDAEGVEGASASKARQYAQDDNYEQFSEVLSHKLSDNLKRDVFKKIRQEMGLEEDADNKNADWYRNMGLRGHFAYSGWG